MNKRSWIHEALNLRFNKKIKINQISKQLNVPRTTLQSLLRRFASSGLSWPVPGECTPEHLGRLLYPGTLRQQNQPASVAQATTPDAPVARRRPNTRRNQRVPGNCSRCRVSHLSFHLITPIHFSGLTCTRCL